MGEVFKWAYIGAGGIARQTADVITKTGRHRVASVYNRTYEKAEEFATLYGSSPYRTIDEAVSHPGIDAVYIATTNDNHYASAKQCLQAGKPVLLEKPFTISKTEALELVDIAGEKGVYLCEAMWTWFSPISLQVKEWATSGEIGEIKSIEISYVNRVSHLYPRLFDPALGGGALLDIGVYPLTYLYNLLGYPSTIKCKGVIDRGVDVEENVTLTFAGGLSVTAEISIVKSPGHEKLVITGTKGTINCPDYHMANKAELIKPDGKSTIEKSGWYENQFDAVAQEIRDGKKESSFVPLKATLDIMEIMDECRRQMGLKYPFEV